ncbi:MAG: hypothetical protein RLZZ623_811, partial [Actinomycetota bacterium]
LVVGATDVGAERMPRRSHEIGNAPLQPLDGLALHGELEVLVLLEHRSRCGTVRAVVQEDHVRVEQEGLACLA